MHKHKSSFIYIVAGFALLASVLATVIPTQSVWAAATGDYNFSCEKAEHELRSVPEGNTITIQCVDDSGDAPITTPAKREGSSDGDNTQVVKVACSEDDNITAQNDFTFACPSGTVPTTDLDTTETDEPGEGTSNFNFEADCRTTNPTAENCGIIAFVVTIINFLSGIVGIGVVLIIVFRGIQYTTARDNPQQLASARDGIRDAILQGLIPYLFITAFLQYLIPGGLF